MSELDNKRRLSRLAARLLNSGELLDAERTYLGVALSRIAAGEDANQVFAVVRARGQKKSDAPDRQRLSLILHWVHCAMFPEPDSTEQAMSLAEACERAVSEIVPLAKRLFPGADAHAYDVEYLIRCHGAPEYKHLRTDLRVWLDNDFPYPEPPKDPR